MPFTIEKRWEDSPACGNYDETRKERSYFKFRKPKADTTGHDDLDEYDFGEDEDADEEPAEIEIHSEDGQEDET